MNREKAPEEGSRNFAEDDGSRSESDEEERAAKRQRRLEGRRTDGSSSLFDKPPGPDDPPEVDVSGALQALPEMEILQGLSADMQLQLLTAAANMVPPGGGAAAAAKKPPPKEMRFDEAKLGRDSSNATTIMIPEKISSALMTYRNKQLLAEETGSNVEWDIGKWPKAKVLLWGSPEQVKAAQRLLNRVSTHCMWGVSEEKITRILKPKTLDGVKIVLSPMGTMLRPFEVNLNIKHLKLSIGKDKKINHLAINDNQLSRQHCVVELDLNRGAVYVMDVSTNGTFLNGTRLPGKGSGKVLLSHGDDLVLKDPKVDPTNEFGYIVNLVESEERTIWKSWEAGTWNSNTRRHGT